uniref:Uncharacterized protein n=1 Tax=Plectus sambesii TaxID=2011161 RepID=A0A914XF51_9BILA
MRVLSFVIPTIWRFCHAANSAISSQSPCSSNPCRNNGTCRDRSLNRYTCECTAPFAGDFCDQDKDECLSTPCFNLGTCNNLIDAFNCSCSAAFSGPLCQTALTTCTAQSPALQAQRILMFLLMTLSLLVLIVALIGLGVVFHYIVKVRSLERALHQAQELSLLCAVLIVLVARARTLFDSGSFCGKEGLGNPPRMSDAVCSSVAVVLHYLFLVYFLLLVLEALHNYMLYTYVFVRHPLLNLTGYIIIALYLPILPVGITGGLLFQSYVTTETCWLNLDSTNMIIEVIPVLLLVATAVVTAEATSMLRNFPPNPLANEVKRTSAITNATGTMFIAPLSLFSWLLGIASVHNVSLTAYICATVLNCLLAFAIVFFHSMGNERARALLERTFCGCCPYYKKKMRRARKQQQQLAEESEMDNGTDDFVGNDDSDQEILTRGRNERFPKVKNNIVEWKFGQKPLTLSGAKHTIHVEGGYE